MLGRPGAEGRAHVHGHFIFDREGYSPDLFLRLKEQRIAILTYHKHPGPDWPQGEFHSRLLTHPNGETSTVLLAERGTRLRNGLWVREVRRLDERGHQSSILSTDYHSDLAVAAASMFARWHQEKFFKYMRQHHGLDRLVEYGTSPLPDTTRLVNPAWRALDSQVRSAAAKLSRLQAAFAGSIQRAADSSPAAAARHERKQGATLEAIEAKQAELDALKAQRKATDKHIELKDLPEEQRVSQLRAARKHFVDTIKLIAYRAETCLVQLVRETLRRSDDARSFVRALMQTTINLRPEPDRGKLRVEIHGLTNPVHDAVLDTLCAELNTTETHYPGTDLRLRYLPVRSSSFTGGQDV